jgi:hypothetical protein
MPVYTDPAGGAALDTIQTINSAVSANASAWGSTIPATFTAPGQSLTLPAIAAADIGKSITVQNAGTIAFTLAIATGSIASAIGLSVSAGSTVVVKATSTTNAFVASSNGAQVTVAESATVVLTSAPINLTTANTYFDVPGASIVLPSAGTYLITPNIRLAGDAASGDVTGAITDGANTIISNGTFLVIQNANTALAQLTASPTIRYIASGPITLKIRIKRALGTGVANVNNDGNGASVINWVKVDGVLPVTGQVADTGIFRLTANIASQGFVANINSGTYTLLDGNNALWNGASAVIPPGRKYSLKYTVVGVMANSGILNAAWVDSSNNPVGPTVTITPVTNAAVGNNISGNTIEAIVTNNTTVNQTYTIRWLSGDPGAILTLSGSVTASVPSASVEIVQIGTVASSAAPAASSLTKSLTYGAVLNARQPVFLQADGKVYPMVGSGGALSGSALIPQYFAAGIEGYSIAAVPANPNRFATAVVYSDGTCYHFWADANPTTGTITQTQNTNITSLTAATAGEGQSLAFNNTGSKGVIAYQNASGLGVAHFSAGANGLSALLGSVNVAGGVSASPVVLPTSSLTKFLVSYRSTVSELRLIDVAAATPVVTALTNFTLNGTAVKSCFIVPLGVADTYAFVNSTTTALQVQPFSFNVTTNLVTLIGAGFSLAGFNGALNYDVIYSDSIETWLGVQRDAASTNILMIKIVQATGAVTFFGPVPFTADAIGSPLAVQIYGHRKAAGNSKFMVAWNTSTVPNQIKYGEWTLDRATGSISVSLAPFLGVTTPAGWNQGRTFGGNAVGAGYAYHVFSQNTGLQSATFGTYQSAASSGSYIGISQSAGAINTLGVVDLIGSVQAGYTGLTPGSLYYADLATGGVTLASTSGILVGRALSATEIQLSRN